MASLLALIASSLMISGATPDFCGESHAHAMHVFVAGKDGKHIPSTQQPAQRRPSPILTQGNAAHTVLRSHYPAAVVITGHHFTLHSSITHRLTNPSVGFFTRGVFVRFRPRDPPVV